jgi:hypothetical protein
MSDVDFNEDTYAAGPRRTDTPQKESGGLSGMIIRWGLAKNSTEANQILIGIIFISLLIAGFLVVPTLHAFTPAKILTPYNYDPQTGMKK